MHRSLSNFTMCLTFPWKWHVVRHLSPEPLFFSSAHNSLSGCQIDTAPPSGLCLPRIGFHCLLMEVHITKPSFSSPRLIPCFVLLSRSSKGSLGWRGPTQCSTKKVGNYKKQLKLFAEHQFLVATYWIIISIFHWGSSTSFTQHCWLISLLRVTWLIADKTFYLYSLIC